MSYRDINNNTVYDIKRKLDYFITPGGSSDMFVNSKNNVLKETVLANSLDKLIARDLSKFMRSLAQEINLSEQLLESSITCINVTFLYTYFCRLFTIRSQLVQESRRKSLL
jgi:hypothetical protein